MSVRACVGACRCGSVRVWVSVSGCLCVGGCMCVGEYVRV